MMEHIFSSPQHNQTVYLTRCIVHDLHTVQTPPTKNDTLRTPVFPRHLYKPHEKKEKTS